jgi:hypothetical protein
MAERLGVRLRQNGMKGAFVVALLSVLLSSCGSADSTSGNSRDHSTDVACQGATGPRELARIDVDGDGTRDAVSFQAAAETPGDDCAAADSLSVRVGRGEDASYAELTFDPSLPVRSQDVRAVSVPGRAGQLVLVVQSHPRGGFAAHLNAWNGTGMRDPGGDKGLVPFVATDAPTLYVAAACNSTGFEVTEARAHQPIGVVPAWDIDRTTYTVDGATFTKGATTEIADNVLDKELHQKYSDLVDYSLFENCRAAG